MNPIIQTEQLTRRFGDRTAVDSVSLNIEPGEVFGLLGPNGAGKTTLVRLLNGILTPSGGSARINGCDPITDGDKVRAQTGVLTETPSIYERLTARDNLRFFGTLYNVPEADLDRRVNELLGRFGLQNRANERVGGYSKGMKQRLALARTLIHQPKILYFDEPTAGLDPEAARDVTELIQELSRQDGRTVFLCTHNLDEAGRLCDRVAIINQGRLLAVGKPEQLARDLWQGLWVDFVLQAAPTPDFEQKVRNVPGVTGINLDGVQLAVQVTAEDTIPGVIAGIAAAGALILRVNPREHSLQEIYFRLQEEAVS